MIDNHAFPWLASNQKTFQWTTPHGTTLINGTTTKPLKSDRWKSTANTAFTKFNFSQIILIFKKYYFWAKKNAKKRKLTINVANLDQPVGALRNTGQNSVCSLFVINFFLILVLLVCASFWYKNGIKNKKKQHPNAGLAPWKI